MDQPLPEWREQYKLWIDMGADAVIASHPHVPQGWEMYNGKPICYSLGNFCFQKAIEKLPAHWNESLCCTIEVLEAHKCKFSVHPIIYDKNSNYISENASEEFKKHLECLNSTLAEEGAYMEYVNKYCLKLLPKYYGLFSRGGFIAKLFCKGFLKGIGDWARGKGLFNKVHAFNNINCESHRWAIVRAMRLEYNI